MPLSPQRRLAAMALAAALVLVVIAIAALVTRHPPTRVDRARALVADDARFSTAEETGVTFIGVAQLLRDEGESCLKRKGATASTCASFFSGSAYAQVSAVQVLNCTRPGVFDAREAMRRYLEDIARGRDSSVPAAVTCR
jgi:hypothetical protein